MLSANEVLPSYMGGWRYVVCQLAQRRVLSHCPFTPSTTAVLTASAHVKKWAALRVKLLCRPADTPHTQLLSSGLWLERSGLGWRNQILVKAKVLLHLSSGT